MIVSLAANESMLLETVDEPDRVGKRKKKLTVYAGKSKIMAFERAVAKPS